MRQLLVLVVLAAGCAAPGPAADDDPGLGAGAERAWLEPILLPGQGYSYEPTIALGIDGAAYVTAHKSNLAQEGGRLASWLWWAPAPEGPWAELHAPTAPQSKSFAFEGDVATDAEGRLYFVDTYLDDIIFARYAPSASGPMLETTRPLGVSVAQDDRPWLAAQGDGVVYLTTNKADLLGSTLPAPGNAAVGNIWLHVSRDRGETWSAGDAFAGSRWCTFAVLPAADAPLHVGCAQRDGSLVAYVSPDQGASFEPIEIGSLSGRLGANFPASAVDGSGRAFHAFMDQRGDETALLLVRIDGDDVSLTQLAPMNGTLLYPALAASNGGRVAVAFQAQDPEGVWRAYALDGRADVDPASWRLVEIDAIGPSPLGDMFDLAFTSDERLVVVYARVAESPNPGNASVGQSYVRVEG